MQHPTAYSRLNPTRPGPMVGPRLRPRFEVLVPCSTEEALARFRTRLDTLDAPFVGSILGRHVELKVPESRRNFWSPQLVVDVEHHAEGTLLRGLYGPHPDVWTMFVALYAVLGFSGVVALCFGLSQWSLGFTPTGLWAVPAATVLLGVVYFFALTGQRLAQTEMHALRAFLDETVAGT